MALIVREEHDYKRVFQSFQELGCCKMCSIRFIGEKVADSYLNANETIRSKHIELEENLSPRNKIQKSSPCIACLGLLQKPYCDSILDSVLQDLRKNDYDCDDFNIALTLPVSFQLRAHSLLLQIKSLFPTYFSFNFPLGIVTVGVKDVWKWLYTPIISEVLKKKLDTNSELTITVSITYAQEEKECAALFSMAPERFSKTKNRKNQGRYDNFSRKSAESFLQLIDSEKFSSYYSVPPEVPSSSVVYGDSVCLHASIFIAGRYNKLSRVLPQTPWILNGERKAEGSVEELISDYMKKTVNAQDSRFAASGREDVDVRTLGRGRPFYIELVNPQKIKLDFQNMRDLEVEINENAKGQIFVRDLQFVHKSSLTILKEGEEKKTKCYRALCFLLNHEARDKCSDKLKELPVMFPLTLQQATPIRVLHRRPVKTRLKEVHSLETTPLEKNKDLFTISLNTQAGTYIKEFVHGDFGRTKPCLGDLLGGLEVDILALDVLDVVLDWPPSVNDQA